MPLMTVWMDDDLPALPNGRLTVTPRVTLGGNEQEYKFQIYTVQSGALQDQRILKYKHSETGAYKGFANLRDDGSIRPWGAFRNAPEHASMIATARQMIAFLQTLSLTENTIYVLGQSRLIDRINVTLSCVRCNESIRTGHWCNTHRNAISEFHDEVEAEERVARADARRARVVERLAEEEDPSSPSANGDLYVQWMSIENEDEEWRVQQPPLRPALRRIRTSPSPSHEILYNLEINQHGEVVENRGFHASRITIEPPDDTPVNRNDRTNVLLSENGTGFVR